MASRPDNEAQTTLRDIIIDAATNTLSADIPCQHCGYNLRSLNINSVCPECGRPVADSVQRCALILSSSTWRRRVIWGINRILLASVAIPVVGLLGKSLLSTNWGYPLVYFGTPLIVIGLLFFLAEGIVGASARDKHAEVVYGSAWPHAIAKITAVLAYPLLSVGIFLSLTGCIILSHRISGDYVEIALYLSMLFGVTSTLSLGLCLCRIAQRASTKALLAKTKAWLVVFVVSVATITTIQFADQLWSISLVTNPAMKTILLITGIAGIVLYLAAIWGLIAYRKHLIAANGPAESIDQP